MLFTNQISLDLLPIFLLSFIPTPETVIFGVIILLSVIVASVGLIIHLSTRKIGETLTKNLGGVLAVAALTDTALNIYNTIQNNKDRQGGGGSSSSPDNSDNSSNEDESSKDKTKDSVKKDNPKEGNTPDSNDKNSTSSS